MFLYELSKKRAEERSVELRTKGLLAEAKQQETIAEVLGDFMRIREELLIHRQEIGEYRQKIWEHQIAIEACEKEIEKHTREKIEKARKLVAYGFLDSSTIGCTADIPTVEVEKMRTEIKMIRLLPRLQYNDSNRKTTESKIH